MSKIRSLFPIILLVAYYLIYFVLNSMNKYDAFISFNAILIFAVPLLIILYCLIRSSKMYKASGIIKILALCSSVMLICYLISGGIGLFAAMFINTFIAIGSYNYKKSRS